MHTSNHLKCPNESCDGEVRSCSATVFEESIKGINDDGWLLIGPVQKTIQLDLDLVPKFRCSECGQRFSRERIEDLLRTGKEDSNAGKQG